MKGDALVISQIRSTGMQWGTYGTDVDTLTNITATADAKADYNGKENTAILVAFQTAEGKTASNSAAINCYEYSTEGTNAGDWYLPAAGELYSYVYGGGTNYSKINTTMGKLGWTFGSRWFWSSSESSDTTAWDVYSYYDRVYYTSKGNDHSVSCFLAL